MQGTVQGNAGSRVVLSSASQPSEEEKKSIVRCKERYRCTARLQGEIQGEIARDMLPLLPTL